MRRYRPSPSMVVALLALVVATGGTAIAAGGGGQAKKRSHHADARQDRRLVLGLAPRLRVKSAKSAGNAAHAAAADTAASAGNASALGGVAPSGYEHAVRWALVNDGQIVAQSGGISVAAHAAAGDWVLGFGSSVAGHAIMTSLVWRYSDEGEASVEAQRCGGGNATPEDTLCPGFNDSSHVRVDSWYQLTLANEEYYIAVL